MLTASVPTARTAWQGQHASPGMRDLAEETAVAITYNRVTHAVMMASPCDLQDFAVGFSLSEGIVPSHADLQAFDAIEAEGGIELRMWIATDHMAALERRRRRLAGATGCGMCGLESLGEALRPVPTVPAGRVFAAASIARAAASLSAGQALNRATHAVHGAGFWTEAAGLVAVREDVGRHNALDKLGGALATGGFTASEGLVLLTSRISIELVQKAARMGAPLLVAISAPTALAVRAAQTAGMTLVAVARDDGFEVFTHEERVAPSRLPAAEDLDRPVPKWRTRKDSNFQPPDS